MTDENQVPVELTETPNEEPIAPAPKKRGRPPKDPNAEPKKRVRKEVAPPQADSAEQAEQAEQVEPAAPPSPPPPTPPVEPKKRGRPRKVTVVEPEPEPSKPEKPKRARAKKEPAASATAIVAAASAQRARPTTRPVHEDDSLDDIVNKVAYKLLTCRQAAAEQRRENWRSLQIV
jgi:hypothetical protein